MGWDVTKDGKWGWLAISDRTIWHFDVLQSLIEKKNLIISCEICSLSYIYQ